MNVHRMFCAIWEVPRAVLLNRMILDGFDEVSKNFNLFISVNILLKSENQ